MRGKRDKTVDLPKYLLAALDEVAAYEQVTLKQLIASWLWRDAKRRAHDGALPPELRARLSNLANPYDASHPSFHPYPRRVEAQ